MLGYLKNRQPMLFHSHPGQIVVSLSDCVFFYYYCTQSSLVLSTW